MKRSSASITLVLISSAVALVACDRPYNSSSYSGSRSDTTTGTRSSSRHRSYYGGTGAWAGARSSRWSGSDPDRSGTHSGIRTTSRGGFGSSSRGFFGG